MTHIYVELDARKIIISFCDKKPPGIGGYVHLRMYTPQVCGLPEHTLEVVKETKEKEKRK